MERLCILFGGRSAEHEISCMSAVSVVKAIDREKYEIILIGITRSGEWLLYDGPLEEIETGEWQQTAERKLADDPEKYAFSVLGSGGRTFKDVADFVLPIIHGTYCEDGKLQGLLEMADIPYGGCGVTASAVAMDKILSKDIFERAGLPVCDYVAVLEEEIKEDIGGVIKKTEVKLGYPVYIKPANMGSSVGVSRAFDAESLE